MNAGATSICLPQVPSLIGIEIRLKLYFSDTEQRGRGGCGYGLNCWREGGNKGWECKSWRRSGEACFDFGACW